MRYLKITQEFAEKRQGYCKYPNTFNYAVTAASEYVCSPNSLIEFPEIFEGENFEEIELPEDTVFIAVSNEIER